MAVFSATDVLTTEPAAVKDESPFSFLSSSGDNTLESLGGSYTADSMHDEIPQRSPFGFIQEEDSQSDAKDEQSGAKPEGESSSFSFLNEPPVTKDPILLPSTSSDVTSKESQSPTPQQSGEDRRSAPSEPYSPSASSLRIGSAPLSPIPPVVLSTTSPPPRVQRVGKQQPPSGTKKKRRAVRPGQGRTDDSLEIAQISSTKDPDSLSVSSQASSLDGGKESVSMSSSSSELQKLAAEETHKTKEETGEQVYSQTEEEEGGRKCSTNQKHVGDTETKPSDLDGGGVSRIGQTISDSQPERTSDGDDLKGGDLLCEEGAVATTAVEEQPEAGESQGAERNLAAEENGTEPSETQLLTEVFASGSQPLANYEVELLPSDKLTALLQSCDSNLGNIL